MGGGSIARKMLLLHVELQYKSTGSNSDKLKSINTTSIYSFTYYNIDGSFRSCSEDAPFLQPYFSAEGADTSATLLLFLLFFPILVGTFAKGRGESVLRACGKG